ncbi:aminoacylase-1 isoform X5 [Nilaparvata lugens]|uniref:aminoacylase-1 isoform X5 n=1 Tax=Nilaparvata lugens TaxID=108931 RepID=UPI000B996A91|nr:aminoacylase-1 isoform X5 [Nilaparvata lugens]
MKDSPAFKMSVNSNDLVEENEAVSNFREYLRIPSVQPNINYDKCVVFLRKQACSLNLPVRVLQMVPGKPIVLITWTGSQPSLPSLLLNSHMDVVPVYPDKWKYDPFGAEKDENGNIYGRGAQDMKCVGIQYIECIRRLMRDGRKLKRTIHLSFVPDEEIGGVAGMGEFVKSDEFRELNIGCALDEGMASPGEEFVVFNGERSIWHMHIHCLGTPGHGSLLLDDTAGEKLNIVINRFMARREQEKKKLEVNPNLTVGDVTTINLTMLKGGVQNNVVPPELVVGFDCRLSVDTDHEEFENWVKAICDEVGGDTWVEFQRKEWKKKVTPISHDNLWWQCLCTVASNLGLKLKPEIFPGGTDSRFIRELGIPAFGFSPMNHTPVLLHDHNEFLNEKIFLKGIDIYYQIITALGNL